MGIKVWGNEEDRGQVVIGVFVRLRCLDLILKFWGRVKGFKQRNDIRRLFYRDRFYERDKVGYRVISSDVVKIFQGEIIRILGKEKVKFKKYWEYWSFQCLKYRLIIYR